MERSHKQALMAFLLVFSQGAYASGGHEDQVASMLLGLMILFLGAKLGGLLALTCKQPAVLGELFAGIVLGNLPLVGITGFTELGTGDFFSLLSSIGVVLLLFEVGLESSLSEMLRVGGAAAVVAIIGVVAPFLLGYGVGVWLMPDRSIYVHIFIGAALSATSVGITARVLKDLGKLHLQEAKIILGAAVIDDVLGLIILAVVGGMIGSVGQGGGAFSFADLLLITGKAVGFLVLAVALGSRLSTFLFRNGGKLRQEGMWLSLAISYCFFLSYLAHWFGLAPIVGAFAAGLTVDQAGVAKFFPHEKGDLEDHVVYLARFFVPIFFVHTGMGVDLSVLTDSTVVLFGAVLTVAAVLGKQVCGWGVWGTAAKGIDRTLIGIGMIPRGEVGLIFAMYGAELMLNGEPVVDKALYSAIVIMVMLTTLMTPPGLTWALRRTNR